MLAKLTSKNQLTLPKSVVDSVSKPEYFDVQVRAGQIVLTPVRVQRGDAVRSKLAELGIDDSDVAEAVSWARKPESTLAAEDALHEQTVIYASQEAYAEFLAILERPAAPSVRLQKTMRATAPWRS
ncbi:DUF1778 domain-containing protein [Acidithiobacillus thiooxidans]|uniref:AbrB family transcriptional regulator n=1 Tax=Acidithiobacillus thiooxidans ATCC 19377 TaxID=637390 RepID=A0A543Q1Y3_ACITH|nr:DUF1778 domain-containing protein [Acidithiobacillus thiooxidans]MDX5935515.1 DUF1778 domain-containing protein [Acidithiobacillus thiooxidans]QFX96127.1 AbrB family transcriptional regulator [Acidithiobacillus thiooxidans ATCC 19377]TQN50344.1 hypothetical protein DLNHIDIE_00197 [Acidithiobacillus thiooxidans ATCC 19377]